MWMGGNGSGFLTENNAYTEITNRIWPNATGGWSIRLWSWNLPLKHKLFTWLTLANNINTWDTLQKKGWNGPNVSHLCFQAAESMQHIFIHCEFTRKVWSIITSALKLQFTWNGATLADCFENWSNLSLHTINIPPLVCWFIWTGRNDCIFENKYPSATFVAYKSLGLHHSWMTFHPRTKAIATRQKLHIAEKSHTGWLGWFDGASQSLGLKSEAGGVLHLSTNCRQGSNADGL
jgi:hypothetical protein